MNIFKNIFCAMVIVLVANLSTSIHSSSKVTKKSVSEDQARQALRSYEEVCAHGNVADIQNIIQEIAALRKNISFMQKRTMNDKDIIHLSDASFLSIQALGKAAFNPNIADLAPIKAILVQTFGGNAVDVNKVVREYMYEFSANLSTLERFIQQVAPQGLANKALTAVGVAAVAGVSRPLQLKTVLYLIKHYPHIMLQKEIFERALDAYDDNMQSKNNRAREQSEAILEALNSHCVSNNTQHHTLLHAQVNLRFVNVKLVEWLLDHGYDPNAKNKKGNTALDQIYQSVNHSDLKGMRIPSDEVIKLAILFKQHNGIISNPAKAEKEILKALHNKNKRSDERANIEKLREFMHKGPEAFPVPEQKRIQKFEALMQKFNDHQF